MAKPYEQDVVLDTDGRSLFQAMDVFERRLTNIQRQIKTINTQSFKSVSDFNKSLDSYVQQYRQTESALRALRAPSVARGKEFESAVKGRGAEAKAFYEQEKRQRLATARDVGAVERETERFLASQATQRLNKEIQAIGLIKNIRQQEAQDRLRSAARELKTEQEIATARANSITRLQTLRQKSKSEMDPNNLRDLQNRIQLERDLIRTLETRAGVMNRMQQTAQNRMAGLDSRAAKLLVRGDVDRMVGTNGLEASKALLVQDQILARRRLMLAATEQEKAVAIQELDLANRRLSALKSISVEQDKQLRQSQTKLPKEKLATDAQVQTSLAGQYASSQIKALGAVEAIAVAKQSVLRAEEALGVASKRNQLTALETLRIERARLVATEEQVKAQQPKRSPTSNILSPGYAGAALARTSVYGVAALAAYSVFNTVQQSLSNVVQLDDELRKLQAIAGATDGQMAKLSGSIFEIARGSRFATTELVGIAQTLAQAGVSASDMSKVLKSVTGLATASGSTPDEAVQLVTSALGSFQLGASEASRVADLMTNALNRTKLTVQQTGQAIQYVGATAFEQNIGLEQLLSTIGAVAQAGIKSGSTIGTGFRQFLVDLQTPSEKLTTQLNALGISTSDVDVKVRGLPAVLETLKEKGFGAAQAYQGLETRAAAFYLVAKNNTQVMDMLQLSFVNQGAAAAANERAMGSLTAQWQRFKNTLSENFFGGTEESLSGITRLLKAYSDRVAEVKEQTAARNNNRSSDTPWYSYNFAPELNNGMREFFNLISTNPFGGKIQGDLGNFIFGLKESAQATKDLSTAVAVNAERVDSQRASVSEVTKEIQRLILQKDSLRNNDTRSASEIVSLTQRFEGLAKFLISTGNRYDDLTQAVRRYRLEQQQLLGTNLIGQEATLREQNRVATTDVGSLVSKIKGTNAYGQLTARERGALANPRARDSAAVLNDAAKRIGSGNLNQLVALLGTIAVNTAQIGGIQAEIKDNSAAQTDLGQRITNANENIQAIIGQLPSATGSKQNQLAQDGYSAINKLVSDIDSGLGDKNTFGDQWLRHQKVEAESLRQQIKATLIPTKAEERAATAADRAATRNDQHPIVTRDEIQKLVMGAYGNQLDHIGSGYRSQANQNGLVAAGRTKATVSDHTANLAQDFILAKDIGREAGDRLANSIRQTLVNSGITPKQVIYETGHGKNQGTKPQVHVALFKNTRYTKDRSQSVEQGYDSSLDQNQLALDQKALTSQLKELSRATTQETFNATLIATEATLEKVKDDIRSAAANELAAKGIGSNTAEFSNRMRQAEEQIGAAVDEYQKKVGDAIVKTLKNQLDGAATTAAEKLAAYNRAVGVAEARVSGLGAQSLSGKVPDYVQTVLQNRAGAASESRDKAELSFLPSQIASALAAVADAQARLAQLPRYDADGSENANYQATSESIRQMNAQLTELETKKAGLEAALGVASQIPTTLGDAARMAVEAFSTTNNLSASLKDTVINNLGGAIEQVNTGLTTMFTDIFTGSKSALAAFGDFARGIMDYLAQLAAQFVAKQILGLIFNVAGAAVGGGGGGGGGGGLGFGGYAFNGGPAFPEGMLSGGRVTNGSSVQDSVTKRLARGEWVVNKDSVDSVGNDFMANLNRHGSKALAAVQPSNQFIMPSKQEMSVYVVAPGSKPSMGPNDVLMTIQDDILRGGETKKLIRTVMQGN